MRVRDALFIFCLLVLVWQSKPVDDPVVHAQAQALPGECAWLHEPDGQIALACAPPSGRGWVIRHLEDVEGGTHEHPNLNLSGGSSPRGYVVLSPDTGKGSIFEGGHKDKLVLVRSKRYGGTEFRIQPTFKRGLIACDSAGCINVMRALRHR